MKILFCDTLYGYGNSHVDDCMINILTRDNKVYLLRNDNLPTDLIENQSNLVVLKSKFKKRPKRLLLFRWEVLKGMMLASKYARQIKPDIIIASTYRTSVFAFGFLLFKNRSKIVVVENNNIDQLESPTKRFFYNLFCNRVHHMVFESFFKDYLVKEIGVKEELIHVVPHIVYKKNIIETKKNRDINNVDCVAISGSNDLETVRQILQIEQTSHLLEKNKIRCKIKCKSLNYKSDFLEVNGDFIPKDEYERLYDNCKVVLIPFPISYKYRMSGCIVDAFSHHKPVVSSDLLLSNYYASKYGSIIRVGKNAEELVNSIISLIKTPNDISDKGYTQFEIDHDEKEIGEKLNIMIVSVLDYSK